MIWAAGRSIADIKRWSLMAPVGSKRWSLMAPVGSQKCGMRPISWQGMPLKTCTCSFQWNIACLHVPYMLPLIFFNLCSYRNVALVISLQSQYHSCCLLKPCPLVLVSSHVCCSVSPVHFILPLQSVSCCKLLFGISISEVTVVGSVSFAFTWDYQVIAIIISINFLFKTVYCCGLPSLSLGYSFHSLWSNFIYNILIKTYISSSQRMENHLIL
jgi:hypothetical protein